MLSGSVAGRRTACAIPSWLAARPDTPDRRSAASRGRPTGERRRNDETRPDEHPLPVRAPPVAPRPNILFAMLNTCRTSFKYSVRVLRQMTYRLHILSVRWTLGLPRGHERADWMLGCRGLAPLRGGAPDNGTDGPGGILRRTPDAAPARLETAADGCEQGVSGVGQVPPNKRMKQTRRR